MVAQTGRGQGLIRLLDDGLDELAAHSHQGFLTRILVTLGAGLLCLFMLPASVVRAWMLVIAVLEAWSWFATRAQHQGVAVGPLTRLSHFGTPITVNAAWVGFCGLL